MTQLTAPDAEFIAFQEAVAGRYSLERELGRGGMGIVYLARELRLARPVAIKVLPRTLAASRPELKEKFLREAQMAAQLSHPNIVPIHHVDEAGEFVFFVMTYIEGETLGERIRARGALPPAEAARVLREIGWALAYAHSRGIVHRDVKPDNILLERSGARALVTDFGIAGAVEANVAPDANYVRGTAHFLSPEQAMGEQTDGRSDIYSLGVVGYYALTGSLPFEGATTVEVMAAHLSQRPRAMQSFATQVPHKLASAVEKCLEKDREQRWASGEKFAEAVGGAFEQEAEVPALLRSWLTSGDKPTGVIAAYVGCVPLAVLVSATRHPALYFLLESPLALALLMTPTFVGARRLLRHGFTLADVRRALPVYTQRRREEIQYEAAFRTISKQALWITAAASFAGAGMSWYLFWARFVTYGPLAAWWGMFGTVATVLGVASSIGALFAGPFKRRIERYGVRRMKFWNGKWGERLMKLAGLGLKPAERQAPALAQHTEVALARATDVLFAALPKNLRRDLRAVPETVRRLESDATSLRDSLDKLDELLASKADADIQIERDVRAERLASTVTALENVRLGLLRLQLGSAPVAQITEALEAASRIGREIDFRLEAEDEIGDVLKPKRIANRDPEPSPV